ncbi:carbamate kinase [Shewanella sp. D64]|uniref:carbamate kinase n=1 Tax=unclassified Shewanella TaxID=196818 RepID=UPI0022BA4E71|nr:MULTISPECIES: carbamate kinase [unclassified Shewanella]MEC4728112.1 carbamate kinase [Shewanella sp. D64]MEC4740232.1 carbamate kinase [Shewanella sp. E94]WBJ94449.1 carbamate kinase [Shewanella sp. MTB7]
MTKPTLVVALGGNALLRRGEPLEANVQRLNIASAVEAIAALTTDWNVVLVHGNGPQVGLLALQNSAYTAVKPYPLDILVAETQGMIGYMLQQELQNALPGTPIVTMLTQVEVDSQDPAFLLPTKYIGPVYDKAEADLLSLEKGWEFKQDGEYIRRVVPSPRPLNIVESTSIKQLINHGSLVICAGGGGIPVVRKGDGLIGVEAVIDKDLSAAFLAKQISADALLILTDTDAVYINWGTDKQEALKNIQPEQLAEMEFDAGSMGPKINAACEFVNATQGNVGIGCLADGASILKGLKGTLITAKLICQ